MRQLSHKLQTRQVKSLERAQTLIAPLSAAHKSVFNYIVRFCYYYSKVDVSQIRIAQDLGLSRQTVNKIIKVLLKKNLITSKENRYKKTCIYKVGDFFLVSRNWERLSYTFSKIKNYFKQPILVNKLISKCHRPMATLISYFKEFIYISSRSRSRRISNTYNVESSKIVAKKTTNDDEAKKEKTNMNQILITPTLRELTTRLNLTKWGQMKLMAFSEDALAYGLNQLQGKKYTGNIFQKLVSDMQNYCENTGQRVDWPKFYHLVGVYNMPSDAKMTLSTPQPVTKPHTFKSEIGTKRHELEPRHYSSNPPHTATPEEDPYDVIHSWERWVSSPQFPKESAISGKVMPHVMLIILEKRIPEQEIMRLYSKYHFLVEYIERARAIRRQFPKDIHRPTWGGILDAMMQTMLQRSEYERAPVLPDRQPDSPSQTQNGQADDLRFAKETENERVHSTAEPAWPGHEVQWTIGDGRALPHADASFMV